MAYSTGLGKWVRKNPYPLQYNKHYPHGVFLGLGKFLSMTQFRYPVTRIPGT